MDNQEQHDPKSILALVVTQEQKDTIYKLFNHYDWEFNEVPVQDQVETSSGNNLSSDVDNGTDVEQFTVEQVSDAEECEYCLCRPSITNESNKQLWWETEKVEQHKRNSALRKEKYKRFWTNLFHRKVWKYPRYTERKKQALSTDLRKTKYVYHRRDLIPKCILELVRFWFHNPPNVPYKGHMWE
ncbi:hypothetical protein KP79_PYT00924 [Mizuhopecten yessoensis]|uniref:Uncharacterized protein n=1 Tax=Mizuhopecten yessoensis TaxID=6573 RepID=A0A210QMQ7_MIZYE|nr:hypothetical protein KP79_PYT00924 [Mizuhopecten yessoensis]